MITESEDGNILIIEEEIDTIGWSEKDIRKYKDERIKWARNMKSHLVSVPVWALGSFLLESIFLNRGHY